MLSSRASETDLLDQGQTSSTAVKAILRIAERWGLTEQNVATLMSVSLATVQRWKRALRDAGRVNASLGPDGLDRASYMLGIYKALHILFPDSEQADSWIKRSNASTTFNGRSPLEQMLGGRMRDLQLVRRHLDGWRG